MKIGLCPSAIKLPAKNFIPAIADFLHKNNIEVYIDNEAKETYALPFIKQDTNIDVFITLGGDGTLLYFADKYKEFTGASFTAINFGSLGFMADIRIENFQEYLHDIINGHWKVNERIMLETISPCGKTIFGINDTVFHRSGIKSMVKLEVSINDVYFNTFQADGLIISTPTGSTAYSLAAGGPIMDPSLRSFAITPICPHAITTRPFIISDSSLIKIKTISLQGSASVTIDGIHSFEVKKDDITKVSVAKNSFKLICFPKKNNSFYSTLREKLGWKGFNY